MRRYLLILAIAALTSLPTLTIAQISPSGINPSATAQQAHLRVVPEYYEPDSTVSIELNAYSINTNGARISWFVDGQVQAAAENERSLSVTTGALGTSQTVQAVITQLNGTEIPVTTTLRPVRIDMLVEADTLTPAFYRGRSLPSSGSTVRVTALPFTGTPAAPSQFSYTWQVGRDIIDGGARIGKNSVTFTPAFETTVPVRVSVTDRTGALVANRTIIVPIQKPELYFYEVNPLRGLQSVALSEENIFRGAEMQVRAEPYYISRGLAQEDFHIAWKLDGQTVSNPSSDPQQISLRRQGNTGSFNLEFQIRNLGQLLQSVTDTVVLRF